MLYTLPKENNFAAKALKEICTPSKPKNNPPA